MGCVLRHNKILAFRNFLLIARAPAFQQKSRELNTSGFFSVTCQQD